MNYSFINSFREFSSFITFMRNLLPSLIFIRNFLPAIFTQQDNTLQLDVVVILGPKHIC